MNLKLIIAALGVTALLATHWFTYKAGINSERAADAKAIMKYQNQMKGLIDELEAEKLKTKVITREKIIRIKQAVDPTGCINTDMPAAVYNELR